RAPAHSDLHSLPTRRSSDLILVSSNGPVFLDAECAVYGDPAFDLAFCAAHLLLKAVWSGDARLNEAAAALVAAYRRGIHWEDAEDRKSTRLHSSHEKTAYAV